MKKQYLLDGLDCASCAAKIETDIKKLDDVVSASVSAVTSTLAVTLRENTDIINEVKRIVGRYEPDVTVKEGGSDNANMRDGHTHGEESGRLRIIRLASGAAIFAIGLILYQQGRYSNLAAVLLIAAYAVLGSEVVFRALKNITKGQIFDENFLMSAATIGAFAIGELPEAVAVMLFYQVGEFFQDSAVRKSKKSIAELMDIRPDHANINVDGELVEVPPETVGIGDLIVVRPGEKIPLDGVVVEGVGMLDTKALTGESLPRTVMPGDAALSGCVSQNSLLTIKVSKSYGESTVAKIIELVENASSKKAKTENFITAFSRYYTPAVVILAVMLAAVPPLFLGGGFSQWIHRGLIFLVISCPCALVISIPLGFFGGIGGASRKGILVKGGNYLEALSNLDIVVFDKTGTLTKGVFEVVKTVPANGFTQEQTLQAAAYAESYSSHPIALSIRKAYGADTDKSRLSGYTETAGQGVRVMRDGEELLAGNAKMMESSQIKYYDADEIGTKVHVAIGGQYAGCIIISDELRPDSREAIQSLKRKGIRKAIMLTGDSRQIAEKTAQGLLIDQVHCELLPHEKVEMLELIDKTKRPKGKLAFVGDGINDAPVLARADIGVAMGGLGSDAAIEAADVVLMTDQPVKLAEAVDIARFTKRIVWQNIFFALGVKALFLLMGAFGLAGMWEAVFADVGVAVLAILNAMRVIRAK